MKINIYRLILVVYPVAHYEFETGILFKGMKLMYGISENTMVIRISEPKLEIFAGHWRNLFNCNL
jgi:hypothetical protein